MSIPHFPSFDDNDTYKVGQENEMVDSDQNMNSGSLFQDGLFNMTSVDQGIDSGENEQSSGSQIFDGPSGYGLGPDDNDVFKVDQSNLMDDSDYNLNDGSLFQSGKFNLAGVDQHIDSGENSQDNTSVIEDYDAGGWGGYFGGFGADGNDTVKVDQSNFMIDTDQNANVSEGAQLGFANLTGIDQDIDSGENSQANTSVIDDHDAGGWHGYFGASGNDTVKVDQSNFMNDADQNANVFEGAQLGFVNMTGVDQGIDSGENSQDNTSLINNGDVGGFGYDDNDAFHVSQASLMADADENINGVETGQFGAFNVGGFDQDIDSGGNSQSNFSEIWDG